MSGPTVTVAQGELLGKNATTPSGKPYYSFQGIPYAKPPIGSLRFKAPQAAEPWEGVRDATAEGNVCAHFQIFPTPAGFVGGEDCLFINVYTPNLDGQFLPVMLWSNSGGFKQGSGNTDMCGPDYLVEKDVIIVTFNYRSGPLGFLCLNTPEVPGNAGLKDQALALKWVKDNIENFGGNSRNITVFGENSGGASASYLTLSPLTKDIMSKAVFQSGTSLNRWASVQNDPVDNAKKLAGKLGNESNDVDDIFNFLQTVPVKDLIETSEKLQAAYISSGTLKFAPVVEKEFPGVEAFLTESPFDILTSGRGAKIPLMIGNTAQEATEYLYIIDNFTIDEDLRSFIPKVFNIEQNSEKAIELAAELKTFYFNDAHIGMDSLKQYLNLLSDRDFLSDIHRYVKIIIQTNNQPLYYYRFSYNGGLNILRKVLDSFGLAQAGHMDDLGYLFNISTQSEIELSSDDEKTRERMVQMWTNFAKTGNPTPDENQFLTISWLPVTKESEYFLDIDKQLTLSTSPETERMQFWDDWYSKHFQVWNVAEPVKAAIFNNVASLQNDSQLEKVPEVAQNDALVVTENEASEVSQIEGPDQVQNAEPELVKLEASEPLQNVAPEADDSQNDSGITDEVDEAAKRVDVQETIEAELNEAQQSIVEVPSANGVVSNGNSEVTNGIAEVTNGQEEQEVIEKIDNVLINEENKDKLKNAQSNGAAKDIIRANDPPEDDLPKNIGVNRFVNFFEALGGKKK